MYARAGQWPSTYMYSVVQRQKAVTLYFTSEQLLLFDFSEKY